MQPASGVVCANNKSISFFPPKTFLFKDGEVIKKQK